MKIKTIVPFVFLLQCATAFCLQPKDEKIISHLITVEKYQVFLEAVAARDDSHALYSEAMSDQLLRITKGDHNDYLALDHAKKEALRGMNSLDAIRYCNWVENGSLSENKTSLSSFNSTEEGSYVLKNEELVSINPDAKYHLLNDDESSITFSIVTRLELKASPLMMFGGEADEVNKEPIVEASSARTRQQTHQAAGGGCIDQVQRSSTTAVFQENEGTHLDDTASSQPPEPHAATIIEGLHHLVLREHPTIAKCYLDADKKWGQQEEAWKNHGQILQERHNSSEKLKLTTEQGEEAEKARADRDENQLGKLKKYLEDFTGMLEYIPEPHVQLAAAGAKKVGSIADWINKIRTNIDLIAKQQVKRLAEQNYSGAQQKADRATEDVVKFEGEAIAIEALVLAQERTAIENMAGALRPKPFWQEHNWRDWSQALLDSTEGSSQVKSNIFPLQEIAQKHLGWVIAQTSEVWQLRLRKTQETIDFFRQEIKTKLASLQQKETEAKNILRERAASTTQLQQQLETAHAQQEELKKQVEQFLESSQQEGEWDQQKFCATFHELSTVSHNIATYQQEVDSALEQQHKQNQQAHHASQELKYEQDNYQRRYQRLKSRLQVEEEQFRTHWPEWNLAYRPYLQWELLAPEKVSFSLEKTSNFQDILGLGRSSLQPPLQLSKELEAQGHRIFDQAQRSIESVLHVSTPTEVNKTGSSSALSSSIAPAMSSEDLAQELIAWSLKQIDQPDEAEKQRWVVCRQLELAEKKTQKLAAKILSEQSSEGLPLTQSNLSLASFEERQAPRMRQVSFGEWSPPLQKNGNEAIMIDSDSPHPLSSSVEHQDPFDQARQEELEAQRSWLELMSQAEKKRADRTGSLFPDSDTTENAWKEADLAVLKEQRHRDAIREEQQIARELQQSWDANTERWRVYNKIDELENLRNLKETELLQLEKESKRDALHRHQCAAIKATITTLQGELQTANEEWRNLAHQKKRIQEAADKESALQQLKEDDGAVNDRWNQLIGRRIDGRPQPEVEGVQHQSILLTQEEQVFQKKKRWLDRIEQLWESILNAHAVHVQHEAGNAARSYHQGNTTDWGKLTEEVRQNYNAQIAQQNQEYDTELANEKTSLEQLHSQYEKALRNSIYSRAVSMDVNETLQMYEERFCQLDHRKKVLAWMKKTFAEKKEEADLFARLAEEHFRTAQHTFDSREAWHDARNTADTAAICWSNLAETIKTNRVPLLSTFITLREVLFQRTRWMQRAALAELKEHLLTKYGTEWSDKKNHAHTLIKLVKTKLWPHVLNNLQAFMEHPNETTLMSARNLTPIIASTIATFIKLDPALREINKIAVNSPTAIRIRSAVYASASAFIFSCAFDTNTVEIAGLAHATEVAKRMIRADIQPVANKEEQEQNDWWIEVTTKAAQFVKAVASYKKNQVAAEILQKQGLERSCSQEIFTHIISEPIGMGALAGASFSAAVVEGIAWLNPLCQSSVEIVLPAALEEFKARPNKATLAAARKSLIEASATYASVSPFLYASSCASLAASTATTAAEVSEATGVSGADICDIVHDYSNHVQPDTPPGIIKNVWDLGYFSLDVKSFKTSIFSDSESQKGGI